MPTKTKGFNRVRAKDTGKGGATIPGGTLKETKWQRALVKYGAHFEKMGITWRDVPLAFALHEGIGISMAVAIWAWCYRTGPARGAALRRAGERGAAVASGTSTATAEVSLPERVMGRVSRTVADHMARAETKLVRRIHVIRVRGWWGPSSRVGLLVCSHVSPKPRLVSHDLSIYLSIYLSICLSVCRIFRFVIVVIRSLFTGSSPQSSYPASAFDGSDRRLDLPPRCVHPFFPIPSYSAVPRG